LSNLRLIAREIRYILPPHLPSALTISRAALAPIYLVLLIAHSNLAFPLYVIACMTDVLDGKLARISGSTSTRGAVLDASADFLLVSAGFYYYMSLDLISPLLLVVMTLSFLQYVLTISIPVKDRLGKHVGTILYILLVTMMFLPNTHSSDITNTIGVSYITASLINRFRCVVLREH
jgi:phosphatidylglycerophosphate synthase